MAATRLISLHIGKGRMLAQWAKVFNLKQRAQALVFMKEHNVSSYEDLETRTNAITGKCDALLTSVKEDEKSLQEIAVLKHHIVNYAKSKDVYAEYKKSGYSRQYFEEHRDLLVPRKAARQAFDEYKFRLAADAAHRNSDIAATQRVPDPIGEFTSVNSPQGAISFKQMKIPTGLGWEKNTESVLTFLRTAY